MKVRVGVFQFVKLSFFAMLLYSSFLMELLEIKISNMTLVLGMLTAILVLADMTVINFNPFKVITPDVQYILLFAILCVLGAMAVATHINSTINGMVQLLQCLLLMIITIYICIREKSVAFCARTIVIVMCAGAVYALMNMESFNSRLTLSESGNANVFGHNAVLGVCLAPLAFGNDSWIKQRLRFVLVIVFSVAVVVSASRMSFIALVAYLGVYLFVISPRSVRKSRFSRGARFAGTLGLATVAFLLVMPYLKDTLILERMEELFDVFDTGKGEGAARVYLYEEAWREFLASPIFGIGYANFAPLHHGVYTHSTYAEILSCTGLVGFVAFTCYYLFIWRELLKGIRLDNALRGRTNHNLLLVFLVLLLLGIGEILIYKIKYFIVFGILAAQFYMNKEQVGPQYIDQVAEGDK